LSGLRATLAFSVTGPDARFDVRAELSLDEGILVMFGPSGVGKTLTLEALAGLRPVTSGHVRVGDETLLDTDRGVCIPPYERGVGYVPQSQALFPFLDVLGNVGFGLPREERRGGRAKELLAELGIVHLAGARPANLSGGEKQRVALARALAVRPRLLLLDEPFASIDDDGRKELCKLVRETIDRHGVPAVLVTHDKGEAVAMGDRAVRFARGKTVESGNPRELLGPT
jgi:molybdate transport system ATP-binding protein